MDGREPALQCWGVDAGMGTPLTPEEILDWAIMNHAFWRIVHDFYDDFEILAW